MKLIIDWYEDGTRKFLRRVVISKDHSPNDFFHAWITEEKIWKDYAIRRLTPEEFEEEFRKRPL